MRHVLEEKVKNIMVQQLAVQHELITATTRIVDDLGADSLAVVELTLALEQEFEIDVPDEDVEALHTFGEVVSYLERVTNVA